MGDRVITPEQAEALRAQLAAEQISNSMVQEARARALHAQEITYAIAGCFALVFVLTVIALWLV